MTRKVKLDIYLSSGAVVRAHVIDYTVQRDGMGRVIRFDWKSEKRHARMLIAVRMDSIDAIVRVGR